MGDGHSEPPFVLDNTSDAAGLRGGSSPVTGAKRPTWQVLDNPARARRLPLDGRSRPARRASALARGFAAALGDTISPEQRVAVERAAQLVAVAEAAREGRLRGDPGISLDDVVRTDGAAARAVRALGLPAARAKPYS